VPQKTLYLVFSHRLTAEQEKDARRSLAVERIVALPPGLSELWRQVPPELAALKDYLAPIAAWLAEKAQPGDRVLVQGDFGAGYLLVQAALAMGLVPVYATTRREVVEKPGPDGSIEMTRQFKHVRFRRYGR